MGNKHTHTIEYKTDPAVMAQLEQLRKQLAEADTAAMVAKNPAVYHAKEKEIFESFLRGLPNLTFKDIIPRSVAGEKHSVIVGNISVGKSSLLNNMFRLSLPEGYGHTTNEASPVVKDAANKIVVWDSPGNNKDFNYLDVETLHFFHSADMVFVMFDSSVQTCDKIVRTIHTMKGNKSALIMAKCDTITGSSNKSLQQEKDITIAQLKTWGITNMQVYATSSKGGFQNNEVLAVMKSPPN